MAGPDTKLSERTVTTTTSGSFFHIIIPDGSGGWLSFRIAFSTIAALFMQSGTYDPRSIAADIFDCINSTYDNATSGLTAANVQAAIDELEQEIDNIVPGETNTASNLGTGEGVFESKSGVNFNFRSLVAGEGIDVDGSGTEILISEGQTLADQTISNGTTTNNIVVGQVSTHHSVYLTYTAIRGTTIKETGEIEVNNLSDTIIYRASRLSDAGMAITKNINGDNIRINIEDTLSDGNDITFKAKIKRVLI